MTKIIELVWAFAQIGITAFGGGLSTLPLIEYQLVTKNSWLNARFYYADGDSRREPWGVQLGVSIAM